MKKEYWDVSDEQVVEETGKKISEWIKILNKYKAAEKKSNEVVSFCLMITKCQGIGQRL